MFTRYSGIYTNVLMARTDLSQIHHSFGIYIKSHYLRLILNNIKYIVRSATTTDNSRSSFKYNRPIKSTSDSAHRHSGFRSSAIVCLCSAPTAPTWPWSSDIIRASWKAAVSEGTEDKWWTALWFKGKVLDLYILDLELLLSSFIYISDAKSRLKFIPRQRQN